MDNAPRCASLAVSGDHVMPKLIQLYIRHSLIGFGIAAVFVALLLWFDISGLRGLISQDKAALLAVFILWFFNGALFAAVQFGYAVMSLAERPEGGGGGGLRAPVRLPARASLRRGQRVGR